MLTKTEILFLVYKIKKVKIKKIHQLHITSYHMLLMRQAASSKPF